MVSGKVWTVFAELLIPVKTEIATVLTVYPDGTYFCQKLGGATLFATGGDWNESDKVFIRKNEIVGSAPQLKTVEIEI